MLTIYFPESFTAEDFEFWLRILGGAMARSGLSIILEPAERIEWWVEQERSLAA